MKKLFTYLCVISITLVGFNYVSHAAVECDPDDPESVQEALDEALLSNSYAIDDLGDLLFDKLDLGGVGGLMEVLKERYEGDDCQTELNSAEKEDIDGLIDDFDTAYAACTFSWGVASEKLDIAVICSNVPSPCNPGCVLFSTISTMTCGAVSGPSAEEALELDPPDYELSCSRVVTANSELSGIWTLLAQGWIAYDTMVAAYDAMEILMSGCGEEE